MAKPSHGIIILCLLVFSISISTTSATVPSHNVLDAVEILSDSGYLAMSLTLQLVSQTLISDSSAVTIFAPSDDAFRESGQPSLSLLQYHFSPIKFSMETLRSLSYATKIPTLFNNHSLIITTFASDAELSINSVTVNGSAIYDVGPLVVYGISNFFDPSFSPISTPLASPDQRPFAPPNTDSGCNGLRSGPIDDTGVLKSRGYSTMATFLDLQRPWIGDEMKLTVFAPVDEEIAPYMTNFTEFPSMFQRHVIPCMLTSTQLLNLGQESTLPTVLEGFVVKVSTSGDVVLVNGVPVIFPDVYSNDWVAVHGVQQMLTLQAEQEPSVKDSFSDEAAFDYGEF